MTTERRRRAHAAPVKFCVVRAGWRGWRVRIFYANGYHQEVRAWFEDRAAVDKYMTRFYPTLAGKEFEAKPRKSFGAR